MAVVELHQVVTGHAGQAADGGGRLWESRKHTELYTHGAACARARAGARRVALSNYAPACPSPVPCWSPGPGAAPDRRGRRRRGASCSPTRSRHTEAGRRGAAAAVAGRREARRPQALRASLRPRLRAVAAHRRATGQRRRGPQPRLPATPRAPGCRCAPRGCPERRRMRTGRRRRRLLPPEPCRGAEAWGPGTLRVPRPGCGARARRGMQELRAGRPGAAG